MKKRIHQFIVNLLHFIFTYNCCLRLHERNCERTASNFLNLVRELGIKPFQLWDVGANESQFSFWIKKEHPGIEIISFEPCRKFKPLGKVINIALSDSNEGVKGMTDLNGEVCPIIASEIECDNILNEVRVVRFDSLGLKPRPGSLLKIDAETYTVKALRGFGGRIEDFDLVVIEVLNKLYEPHYWPYEKTAACEVFAFMLKHGFNCSRILETGLFYPDRITHTDIAFWKGRS